MSFVFGDSSDGGAEDNGPDLTNSQLNYSNNYSSGPGAIADGDKSQWKSLVVQGAAEIYGSVMLAKCGWACSSCCWYGIAALGTAKIANHQSKKASRYTGGLTMGEIPPPGTFEGGNEIRDPNIVAGNDIDDKIDRMKDLGYDINLKTGNITTPDGQTITKEDLADSQSLAQAGVSASQIALVESAKAEASSMSDKNAKAKAKEWMEKASVDSSEMGGSSGSVASGFMGGAARVSLGSYGASVGKKKPEKAISVQRTPAQDTTGLSTQVGGDRIGVNVSDIFQNINGYYKSESKANKAYKREY